MRTVPVLLAFWRVPYRADTWRRFGYAVLAPFLAVVGLMLVLIGRARTAARYQRRLASRLVGSPASEPLRRPTEPKVIGLSVLMLAVGLAGWLLLWRFTYEVLAVPLAANCLALVLAGRAPAVGRFQRRLARRLAGSAPRWMGVRVAAHSVVVLAVGVVSWSLLAYFAVFAVGNLAFPFLDYVGTAPSYGGPPLPWDLVSHIRLSYHSDMWTRTYPNSNGGPTLAGAWAYHAGQFFVTWFPLLAWAIRGLTRVPSWFAQALLGRPEGSPAN